MRKRSFREGVIVHSASLFRSTLFVPGNRPERFEKAASSGADLIAIDLEDAVPPENKDEARATVMTYLPQPYSAAARRFVRINSPKTPAGLRDLGALIDATAIPDGILIPMVATAAEVQWVDGLLAHHPSLDLIAVIETTEGLDNAYEIAGASPRLRAVGFGSADFTSETGGTMEWDPLLYPRSRIAAACARHKIIALDGVWLNIADDEGLIAETRAIKALGYRGKIAIHPKQIAGIHTGFAPTEKETERARKVVAAFEEANGAAIKVDGLMVDLPLYESAQRTLAAVEA
ncbi:MAG: CoA ester lyase [Proteobacteria bacterium]|nr:CoA ester lyase [Pseudomonadota bacterium]MDA1059258.1 CoA ester lyase [Pseudomonadota bacterium]